MVRRTLPTGYRVTEHNKTPRVTRNFNSIYGLYKFIIRNKQYFPSGHVDIYRSHELLLWTDVDWVRMRLRENIGERKEKLYIDSLSKRLKGS